MQNFGVIFVAYNPEINTFNSKLRVVSELSSNVVVVNNGNAIPVIKNIKIINLSENKGIAYAQNVGVEFLKRKGIEFVFFFDQDSDFDSDYFSKMLFEWHRVISAGVNIGILSPNLFDRNRHQLIPINQLNNGDIDRRVLSNSKNELLQNTLPISSGILTTVTIFNTVGGNNADLFIDWVDLDFDLKILNAGYITCTTSTVCLRHAIGKNEQHKFFGKRISPSNHIPFREFYYFRNGIFLCKQDKNTFPEVKKMIKKSLMVRILYCFYEKNKIQRIINISRGIADGLMNRM